ncbi:hypothetical protein Y1Q_0014676 [Alligator mississippiensis]|uniref:Uncharacterized protein n=1 Tax=Alligator mississippiensis TaxID=8496 RepID=A0A151P874_ALLMI|nr:hypothetical protein Y1Q_0014676 [Alligator mississippiensis]
MTAAARSSFASLKQVAAKGCVHSKQYWGDGINFFKKQRQGEDKRISPHRLSSHAKNPFLRVYNKSHLISQDNQQHPISFLLECRSISFPNNADIATVL